MNKTKIQWTDYSWPIVNGCRRKSSGCEACYAERLAATRLVHTDKYKGLAVMTAQGPRWTGQTRLWEPDLFGPLKLKTPSRIFVADMGDLFYEGVADADIDRVFAVMGLAKWHTFQVLTKRAKRMYEYCKTLGRHHEIDRLSAAAKAMGREDGFFYKLGARGWCLPNVHLGVSVEDPDTANERLPWLLRTAAVARFVSYEPALKGVDFRRFLCCPWCAEEEPKRDGMGRTYHMLDGVPMACPLDSRGEAIHSIDQIIVGGESGPRARPFNLAWARETITQCKAARVACFVKQLGARPYALEANPPFEYGYGHKVVTGDVFPRDKKGGKLEEMPAELRVRETPTVR